MEPYIGRIMAGNINILENSIVVSNLKGKVNFMSLLGYMMGNSKTEKNMVMDSTRLIIRNWDILENMKMVWSMEKEPCMIHQINHLMKDNGKMDYQMDKEPHIGLMAGRSKANFLKESI